jgi:hypothetical protein
MRVTVFDFEAKDVAALRKVLGLDVIAQRIDFIIEGQGNMAANFDNLNRIIEDHNTAVSEVGTALADALGRVEADVTALREAASDEADQAAVDSAASALEASTTALRGAVSQLQGLDPVPPVEEPEDEEPTPTPTDPTEPTEPTDPTEPTP